MPTLPNMGLVTPTLGGDSGTWDDKCNAIFGQIDAHDHTSGKGVQVPTAGININADLAFGGYALTALGKLAFTAVAALASGSKTLFVNSADNELYWRTNAGTNVKLTNGASINTTLVGGIVGDYSSVGAALAYDDANKRYTLKTQTGTWARLATGPVRIYEYNTSESVYVEQAVDAALAASYTVTWPAALPGSQTAVQITAAGAVVFSNSFSGNLTAADFRYTSAQTYSVGVLDSYEQTAGTHTKSTGGTSGVFNRWLLAASAVKIVFPLHIPQGCTIKSFTVYLDKQTNNTATVSARMYKTRTAILGTESAIGTAAVTSNANSPGFWALASTGVDADYNETVSAGFVYYVVFTPSGSVTPAADTLYDCEVSYTRP